MEIPEEKVVERIQDSTAFVGAQHGTLQDLRPGRESQRRFSEVQDLVVVSEGQPLPPERVAERLARIDALLTQVSLDEEEEVMEEEIPEVQPSRFQAVFRPRRLCPNLLRGSQCHYGNRCTFAHAFHELADEGWYVPGSCSQVYVFACCSSWR